MPQLSHVRTTIDLPDELLQRARQRAAESGVSLSELLIFALEHRLATPVKVRRDPPTVEGPVAMPLSTRQEIDEAMFG